MKGIVLAGGAGARLYPLSTLMPAGTRDILIIGAPEASRQGVAVSAPGEIAFVNRCIDRDALRASAARHGGSPCGAPLRAVAEGKARR